MVHWGFLIVAFALGFLACYGILYLIAKEAGGFLEWPNEKIRGDP